MHRKSHRYRLASLVITFTLFLSAGALWAGEGQGAAQQDQGSFEQHLVLHLVRGGGAGPGEELHTLDLSFADHSASRSVLHFGAKVPIATTTFNFTQHDATGVPIPVTAYTYQNLGFQVSTNPYPRKTADGLVAIGFKYELNYLDEPARDGEGNGSPVINTREANRVLALAPGERLVVAQFHNPREIEVLARSLGLPAADPGKRPWQLILELLP